MQLITAVAQMSNELAANVTGIQIFILQLSILREVLRHDVGSTDARQARL